MINRKNIFVRILLLPFALLYSLATNVRNLLFDWKILPSKKFPVPVICIGNISVGGTGKTPFTEYLITLLKKQYRVAMLSRGYRRKTKGFVLASDACTSDDIGDESCQIKRKFPNIIVAVDANRRRGISRLINLPEKERPDVILLDDAMQHRYVTPSLTIMLTDYNNMYYDDYILPVGNLRESAQNMYNVDIIVVTKCPDTIKPINLRIIENSMSLMASQHLYFSMVRYHNIEAIFKTEALKTCSLDELEVDENILVIAGIANPQPLIDKVILSCDNVRLCIYPDHHDFTQQDLEHIDSLFSAMPAKRRILCTEKDAMRLKTLSFLPEKWKPFLYYLPISVELMFDQRENFDSRILKHVISTINIYR